MPNWNANFTNDDDWTAVSFIEMFYKAANERITLLLSLQYPPALLTVPVLGTDVQSQAKILPLQGFIQAWLDKFVNTTLTIQASSIALVDWKWTTTTLYAAAGMNAGGFTRKYPREFANEYQTTYTDGSAVANGHRARQLSDLQIYDRVAGAWVLFAANPKGAAPDTITAYGAIQVGDYIGPWIWNEIRNCLNLMIWTFGQQPWYVNNGDQSYRRGYAQVTGTWAATQTAVEADWDGNANNGNSYSTTNPYVWDWNIYIRSQMLYNGAGIYQGYLEIKNGYARTGSLSTAFAKSVDFYALDVPLVSQDTPPVVVSTFDANGYPALSDAWSNWQTNNELAAVTASVTGNFFDWTVKPLWDPGGPPTTSANYRRGVNINNGDYTSSAYIVRWDVAGGFSYVA